MISAIKLDKSGFVPGTRKWFRDPATRMVLTCSSEASSRRPARLLGLVWVMKSLWNPGTRRRGSGRITAFSHRLQQQDQRNRDVQKQYLTTSLILRPRPRLHCLLGNKAAVIGSGLIPPLEGGYEVWTASTVPHGVHAAGWTPRLFCSPFYDTVQFIPVQSTPVG